MRKSDNLMYKSLETFSEIFKENYSVLDHYPISE